MRQQQAQALLFQQRQDDQRVQVAQVEQGTGMEEDDDAQPLEHVSLPSSIANEPQWTGSGSL